MVKIRFENTKTNRKAFVELAETASVDNIPAAEKEKARKDICEAESLIDGNEQSPMPRLLPLDTYLTWAIYGNAVKSYWKKILLDHTNGITIYARSFPD